LHEVGRRARGVADRLRQSFALRADRQRQRGGDTPVAIFIKAFPSNGRLALCGYCIASGGSMMTDLLAQMLSNNDSVLRLAEETVGNLSFLYPNARTASELDATASCVLARSAWKPEYATGRIELSTPSARMHG
jgi:hypothetical protein